MSDHFTKNLLAWHRANPRELPWKNDKDAYSIWLSEIIMQQTRVEYGSQYYLKFKELFPTVKHLAKADLQDVMKAWEGLGYYSRARNLHHTAKVVSSEMDGKFPKTVKGLQQLKGIGPYTASAIASFAFNVSKSAIDGNAYRVLARYFGIATPIDTSAGKKQFQALGDELIDKQQPAEFNQALMNFGALVCTPKSPNCIECPMQQSCMAFSENAQSEYPVKAKAIKMKQRFFTFLLMHDGTNGLLQERIGKDVWRNLYQFIAIETPNEIEWQEAMEQNKLFQKVQNQQIIIEQVVEGESQQLSHQKIDAQLVVLKVEDLPETNEYRVVALNNLRNFAFPKLIHQLLKKTVY